MGLEFAKRIGQRECAFAQREAAFDQRIGDAFVPAAIGQQMPKAQDAVVRDEVVMDPARRRACE